jgi:hypothetical protein
LPELATPADIYTTVLEAFGADGGDAAQSEGMSLLRSGRDLAPRQFVLAAGANGDRAIRTPAWMLLSTTPLVDADSSAQAIGSAELYLKPDDRWEANEVADRLPDVVTRLLSILARLPGDSPSGPSIKPITLDDDLIAHSR